MKVYKINKEMRMQKSQKAFTMLELVFVIVVIGILSAIAIPKFAVTRNDAVITKTKVTIASVRSALATERQKNILRGRFSDLNKTYIGNNFANLLEYKVKSCNSGGCGGWKTTGSATAPIYTFYGPGGNVVFNLNNNRLECNTTSPSTNHCTEYE